MTSDNAFYLGIDPSARKIAVVAYHPVLRTQAAWTKTLYKTGRQTNDSLADALKFMEQLVETLRPWKGSGPGYVWVEDPVVGRGGASPTIKQAFVGGIVRGTLVRAGYSVYNVNVSVWKKQVCGTSKADKNDVARAVRMKWPKVQPLVGDDSDLIDAAAIAIYGRDTTARARLLQGDAQAS